MPKSYISLSSRASIRLSLALTGLTALLPMTLGADSPAPATPPAATAPPTAPAAAETKRINDAIDSLASDDFAVREQAVKTLWQIGTVAIPSLQEATTSGNPEVARRARSILSSFAFGIRPDTPQEVIDQLNAYRQGDPEQKRKAVAELVEQKTPGARVLLKLARDETDVDMRRLVKNGLVSISRYAVASMVAEGDLSSAEQVLAMVVDQGEPPSRDQAAYFLLTGKLKDAIAATEKQVAKDNQPVDQLRLSCLYRANGDAAKAAIAADAAKQEWLGDALLAQSGDYAELARRIEARPAEGSPNEIALRMAYYRLAGQRAEADQAALKLIERAKVDLKSQRFIASTLLLHEHADQALSLLQDAKDYNWQIEFTSARFDTVGNDKIVEQATERGGPDLPLILAKSCPTLHLQGRTKEAVARLKEVARGDAGVVDLDVWKELISSAPLSGMNLAEADKMLAQAVSAGDRRRGGEPEALFSYARFKDAARARAWWQTLTDHRTGKTPAEAIAIVRRLDRKLVVEGELNNLLEQTKKLALDFPGGRADIRRLLLVAETMADNNRTDDAIALFQEVLKLDTVKEVSQETLIRIGEIQAKAGKWEPAIEAFNQARQMDSSDATAVALVGWGMMQSEKKAEGEKLLELAHLMPLGDESARADLADSLAKHGLPDHAKRERELCLLLGDVKSWSYQKTVRIRAVELAKTDPTKAAAMWERAFLENLLSETTFIDPIFNLTMPVMVRRLKAVGNVRAGKLDEAQADAAFCLETFPADADAQIAIIRELDKAGKKRAADKVYKAAITRYQAVRDANPNSAQANNLIAWLSGCVSRDLDGALAAAKKGLELDPGNTAILDTLSEVLYARKEYDEALKINEQCRTLEPYLSHHRKNQARFTAAKAGKVIDPDDDTEED